MKQKYPSTKAISESLKIEYYRFYVSLSRDGIDHSAYARHKGINNNVIQKIFVAVTILKQLKPSLIRS